MSARLKKEPVDTPHKENVLRSLAFWIGHERASLNLPWNLVTFLKLFQENKQAVDYKEGVRVGFALYGRGDVIDHEIVDWLKKEIKDYIEQSLDRFFCSRWGKVKSRDITTLYVDFPKEEELSDPTSYRQCLRAAVSLAHQIAIRWPLSKYCTKKRFLSIGIAGGDYAYLDNYLFPILNIKLPGDPVIRITDHVRQCILINDIRVILCNQPNETSLINGEALTIWWVVELWSTIYFDFIPDLLTDTILQNDSSSVKVLTHLLWTSNKNETNHSINNKPNAITTFFKFPHNSLLGIEIAKTLYYRRRFLETLEILRIVLSIDPNHLNARILRMLLFRNMALDASCYSVAEDFFAQAEQEALYIQKNCFSQAEDFYCEYAVTHLTKAMLTLRYMRNGKGSIDGIEDIVKLKEKIFRNLNKAEKLFRGGMTVSPSGIRSVYLLDSVKLLEVILQNDGEIFVNPNKPIDGRPAIVKKPLKHFQEKIGYQRRELSQEAQYDFMEAILYSNFITHDDSISLQADRPTTYFCTAVACWDFFPIRTVAIAKKTLQLLKGALQIAKDMEQKDVCIYSFTRTYGEMLPSEEFIQHIENSI